MALSAPSFFQVNTAGAERLVQLALDGLKPQADELAVDLYCGAGTFTLPLAGRCDAVVGVESYGPAVRDLAANVKARGLGDQVEVIGDDAARQLDILEEADVVVVDPPRAGLDAQVVQALGDSPARAVAYVSCDPATLARDLALFEQQGRLRPVSVTPVDLLPPDVPRGDRDDPPPRVDQRQPQAAAWRAFVRETAPICIPTAKACASTQVVRGMRFPRFRGKETGHAQCNRVARRRVRDR